MRVHLGAACATIIVLTGTTACGSYSAPDNAGGDTPAPPDSTSDTTSTPPPAPPPPYVVK